MLVIGLTMAVCAGGYAYQLNRQNAAVEARLDQPDSPALHVGDRQAASTQLESRAVQLAMSHLTVPWETLFASLETLAAPRVQLIELHPDAAQGRLKLVAEAPSQQDMLEYTAQVGKLPTLRKVLLREHARRDEEAEPSIRFTLEAEWNKIP
jgi:hypothetical protein